MLKKEDILKKYKKHYKQSFLLAWAKFLTYDELVKTDNMEILEKESMLQNGKEWDKNVLTYNEANVTNALCIAVDTAMKDILMHDGMSYMLYYDDICEWLHILENKDLVMHKKISKSNVMAFYNEISDYYKFGINYN